MAILDKAKAIRSEAWQDLMSSPSFAAFKAADDFVLALGGGTAMPSAFGTSTKSESNGSAALREELRARAVRIASEKRITQVDAADAALREAGEPLPVGRFMEAAMEKGAEMTGKNPLSNFRSAVSKDDRFYSFKRNNMHFWWFTGEPLPPSWIETASPDLVAGLAASTAALYQEGGEADATAT